MMASLLARPLAAGAAGVVLRGGAARAATSLAVAVSKAAPPHPASILPLPPRLGAEGGARAGAGGAAGASGAGSRTGVTAMAAAAVGRGGVRPGLAAALVDAIGGAEAKVASILTRERVFMGKAAALNPGGAPAKRRKRGDAGSLRVALEAVGMAPSGATVAPGAAGGKRVNFQPETLRQVARALAQGQPPAAKAAIASVVSLRLREQEEREKRERAVALADAMRASAGRSAETGAPLTRAQALALARYMLAKAGSEGLRSTGGMSGGRAAREAAERRLAVDVTAGAGLMEAPFVLTRSVARQDGSAAVPPLVDVPHPSSAAAIPGAAAVVSAPSPAPGLRDAFAEPGRAALAQAAGAARGRARLAAAGEAETARNTARDAVARGQDAEAAAAEAELEAALVADGAAPEEVAALREVHASLRAAREGSTTALGVALPEPMGSGAASHPVLGADARITMTRDDARRAFVAWMAGQDRLEKAFLAAAVDAGSAAPDLAAVRARVEGNRRLRLGLLRRGDVFTTWGRLAASGYDTLVLLPGGDDAAAAASGAELRDID